VPETVFDSFGWVSLALFIRLIIHLFQLVFSAGIVFFSHNKSANNVFQPAYQHSRTGPLLDSMSVRLIKVPLGNQTRPKPSFPPFYLAAARAGHFGAAGVVRIQNTCFFFKKKEVCLSTFHFRVSLNLDVTT
jgi:hypothetical protein